MRGDVEAHVLRLVGVAQVAQHTVGGNVADGAAAHGPVLDGDDGVREAADVVQHDLAVRAEHLGKAADDRQQRLQVRVERLLEQTVLRSSVSGGPPRVGTREAPSRGGGVLHVDHGPDTRYTPTRLGMSKKVGSLPEKVAKGRRHCGAAP